MKKLLVVVLALVMAFAFCGAAMAAQEVVFWNVLTGNGGELMQKWAEEFNASQSDYYINMTYSGSYEESLAKYQSTTKGNRPDVVMVSTEYVAFFADNPDYFVPVQKYIDEVGKKNAARVKVSQFIRFEKGEGLKKREENFAEEVAKQMA